MSDPSEKYPESERSHGYRSFFWPIILIGVGVVWLLVNLGLVQVSLLNVLFRFWPLIFVLIGIDIIFARRYSIVGALLGLLTVGLVVAALLVGGSWLSNLPGFGFPFTSYSSKDIKSQQFSEPVGKASSAVIRMDLNRWPTTVTSGDTATLIKADVDFVGDFNLSVQGDQVKTVTLGQTGVQGIVGIFNDTQYRWDIALSPGIPMELDIKTGSGSNELLLDKLQLTKVAIEGGSGSSRITLPATEAIIPITLRSHSGSFNVSLPQQSNTNLDMTGGSGSIQFSLGDQRSMTMRWKGASGSQSIDIGSGVSLDAQMDTASGSVTINLPANAAVRITVQHAGSGSVTVPQRLQHISGSGKEGTWESNDYGSAQKRITIVLSTGSGSVTIH